MVDRIKAAVIGHASASDAQRNTVRGGKHTQAQHNAQTREQDNSGTTRKRTRCRMRRVQKACTPPAQNQGSILAQHELRPNKALKKQSQLETSLYILELYLDRTALQVSTNKKHQFCIPSRESVYRHYWAHL